MDFNQALIDELNVLMKFSLDSEMTGIKVHSDANERMIEAAMRLHEKKLITQEDGGYLTTLGREVAESARHSFQILTTSQ